jgi:MFS family permease
MSRDLRLIALSLFAWGLGEGMFLYFQPLYLQKWGATPLEIGGILGMAGLAAALTMAPAGYLADRWGPRLLMWIAWILGTIAALTMAAANSLPAFVAGVVIYGLTAFVSAPMNSYLTSARGSWSVERTLTLISATYQFGAVAGPVVGGLIGEKLGLPFIYRFSAGLFLLSTVLIFFIRRPPTEEAHHDQPAVHKSNQSLLKSPQFVMMLVMIFFSMFALYLPQPLTPIYLQNQQHLSTATIGALGSFGNLGTAVIMLVLGGLSAPVGLITGMGLVGLFALTLWQGHSLPVFFIGYFFIGGYRLSRSMVLAYSRTLVKAGEIGFAYGLAETGNSIATILAPLAAGYIYGRSPEMVYIISLAAIGVMIIINITRMPKSPWKRAKLLPVERGEQDVA